MLHFALDKSITLTKIITQPFLSQMGFRAGEPPASSQMMTHHARELIGTGKVENTTVL
jgi:hypothetical protein